jgi:pSer/pThr/pTyr-binding forkhead associated (FHA) protein
VEGPLAGKQFILYRSPTVIGSSPKCDITLVSDKSVAPQHAAISQTGGQHSIADLGSPGGTRVNGQAVRTRTLRSGDRIGLGQTTFIYEDRAVRE